MSSSFPAGSPDLHSVVHTRVERSRVFLPGAGSTAGLRLHKLDEREDPTMRSGAGLCVLGLLGLLCLHSSVFGQAPEEVQPGILLFCDSPMVEKVVSSAVDKFNERLSSGKKLALYQILSAVKSENDTGSMYSLQFTTRRSDCSAGSNKPWTDCDYLSSGHKNPTLCNATVLLTETEADTLQVDCQIDSFIVPEKASCLGCPEEIDENSEDVKAPISASIAKFNSISDSTHLFTLNSVGHATRQVIAGFRFKLRFDMKKTTCTKAEHKDLNDLCVPDDQDVEFRNCNSTVDFAPWRHESTDAELQCEAGALPPMLFTRRRPTGWSPLRNILLAVTSSSPTIAPPKEDSSEEDVTALQPTDMPVIPAEPVSDSPFHCPSKPWKTFQPVQLSATGAPTEATPEESSPQPSENGFSDADLLA
ncbi:kininogen-1 isoform X2 [Hippoglossus hippoglossus]|uniref:kininogen-1 isoform X2 n=1 Tax=Hippoglossus hippoglossus TaxID=8267 RepID=UPI00148DBFE1|nr:kininogen-1 isoform X2 [Hippoglossus hippoglossus]